MEIKIGTAKRYFWISVGDKVFRLYTDGRIEANFSDGAKYKVSGLVDALVEFFDIVLGEGKGRLENCGQVLIYKTGDLVLGFWIGKLRFRIRDSECGGYIYEYTQNAVFETPIGIFVDENYDPSKFEEQVWNLLEKHKIKVNPEKLGYEVNEQKFSIVFEGGKVLEIEPFGFNLFFKCFHYETLIEVKTEVLVKWFENVLRYLIRRLNEFDFVDKNDSCVVKYGYFTFEYDKEGEKIVEVSYQAPGLKFEFNKFRGKIDGDRIKLEVRNNREIWGEAEARLTPLFLKVAGYYLI